MRKIAVASHKGGVGKSTTVINVGAALAKLRAGKHDGASAYHQSAHAGREAQKQKVKATYYLSQQELEMVTHLYIKQLRKHNKGDKSSIICESIRLIYERDK